MKILKYITFTFFLLIKFSVSAEVVNKIIVDGNSRISLETIKVYGNIDLNKDYSNFDINNILKSLYDTNFFESIDISLENNVMTLKVKEYPTINSIDFKGEKSIQTKKYILEQIQLKDKQSFIKNKLTEDINTINKLYSSLGFNFANVEAKIESFDNNRINLIFFS